MKVCPTCKGKKITKWGDTNIDAECIICYGKGKIDETEVLQRLLNKWNGVAIPLGLIKRKAKITPKRLKHFKKRCEDPEFLECFDNVLDEIKNSDFLQGKVEQSYSRFANWRISIDGLLERQDLWRKIYEGNYSDQIRSSSKSLNLDELMEQNETDQRS